MMNKRAFLFAAALAGVSAVNSAPFPPLEVVATDPLVKIFRDEPVAGAKASAMDAARGEHASFQIVVKSGPVDLRDVRCEVAPFSSTEGAEVTLTPQSPRFVGYIGSSISATKTTPTRQLRAAPAMYPDPLIPQEKQDVQAGSNQALWLTVPVPVDARPGDYASTATITARMFGVDTSASVALKLKVHPAQVKDTRLNVTLWYQTWHHDDWKMPERFSDAWLKVISGYVKSMTTHRINWGWIETQSAVEHSRDSAGKLQFDFTNFDKWMNVLLSGGMKRIEGQHYAFRTKGWTGPFGVQIYVEEKGKWKPQRVAADSPEGREYFAAYLPALQSHLEEKGWLDKYMQHVADEPLDSNVDSYTTAAQLLKTHAPKLRVMEACQSQKVVGLVNTWVPQLDHFHHGYDFFRERMAAGDEVWFYTCMYPQGDYPNRFLEQPLIETRLLHWMNYHYDATGYLHWGWNFWPPHPWENAADFRMMQLPGGDAQIVYPEPGTPGVWDSIRHEAMRDGIEDHELLSQLGEKDKAAAKALTARLIKDFEDVEIDPVIFREVRRELLTRVSETGR